MKMTYENGKVVIDISAEMRQPKMHQYQATKKNKDGTKTPLLKEDGTPDIRTIFTVGEMPFSGNLAECDLPDGLALRLNKQGFCLGKREAVRASGTVAYADVLKTLVKAGA